MTDQQKQWFETLTTKRRKGICKNYTRNTFGNVSDYILFYSKKPNAGWNLQYDERDNERILKEHPFVEEGTGHRHKRVPVHIPGVRNGDAGKPLRDRLPPAGKHWQHLPTRLQEMDRRGGKSIGVRLEIRTRKSILMKAPETPFRISGCSTLTLTTKNTISAQNYYDNFVSVIVGWSVSEEAAICKRYTAFETNYAARKSGNELKSTTIKSSQSCVRFANSGVNLFPAKVVFWRDCTGYHAQVL